MKYTILYDDIRLICFIFFLCLILLASSSVPKKADTSTLQTAYTENDTFLFCTCKNYLLQ